MKNNINDNSNSPDVTKLISNGQNYFGDFPDNSGSMQVATPLTATLMNCNPSLWWPTTTSTTLTTHDHADMKIEFVSNGFILTHLGQKHVAPNLGGLFKVIEKIIKQKLDAVKKQGEKKNGNK